MSTAAFRRALLIAAALASSPAGARTGSPKPLPPANAAIHGVWRNPYNSVDLRIEDCGDQLCGVVVGATAEALTDARDSGYPNLIGLQLLRDYRADGPRHWSGTVLVPDLGHSFSSHLVLIDPGHVRIAGCLWHQFLCKNQIWRRL